MNRRLPKINIPTVRPELVEGVFMLRQAQHERQHVLGTLFFGSCHMLFPIMSDVYVTGVGGQGIGLLSEVLVLGLPNMPVYR